MRIVFILLSFLGSVAAFGQDSLFIQLHVVDKDSRESIKDVRISMRKGDLNLTGQTDENGFCSFYLKRFQDVTFSLRHNWYEDLDSKQVLSNRSGDTILVEFALKALPSQTLKGTVVTAPGVPQVVYGSEEFHVADFELMRDGKILLLVYSTQLHKKSELFLYDGSRVLNRFEVPDRAETLVRDFRGRVHLLCENQVFTVLADGKNVEVARIPKDYFLAYVAPIVDTNKMQLYFSNFSPIYPAFDYLRLDQLDSAYYKIMKIEDELMMELYLSEYKWVDVRTKMWAREKERESGIEAEVWVGANYFTQSLYYKELYAPLFHRNDSIFVFDHYKNQVVVFNELGLKLDSIPISYHLNPKQSGWQKMILQDHQSGEIYLVHEKSGYVDLCSFNVSDGRLGKRVRLKHRYVDKIRIDHGQVYYVYRPFESTQKRFLYRVKLVN